MDSSVPPHPFEPRPRRRDRHGRGMRGPVAPPQRYAASVMDSSVPPHPFEPRPRRRDRHGRGMR
ncbi:hypothetical protein AB0C94_18005, partial [Streptomyces griseus]